MNTFLYVLQTLSLIWGWWSVGYLICWFLTIDDRETKPIDPDGFYGLVFVSLGGPFVPMMFWGCKINLKYERLLTKQERERRNTTAYEHDYCWKNRDYRNRDEGGVV